jgi:predicted ATP-grasp superfamily ATP-dependent carboligase
VDAPRSPADWLVKPLAGSGGAGIRAAGPGLPGEACYFQERVQGLPAAAVFLAAKSETRLLGATRQLVGEEWLNAPLFAYCGSLGPLRLEPEPARQVAAAGRAVAKAFGLRGLFGLDLVIAEERAWTVELNPRYTASVEVLEHALGICALDLHCRAFGRGSRRPSSARGGPQPAPATVGKAVLYAPEDLEVKADLGEFVQQDPWSFPELADLPARGEVIRSGRPLLTVFARAPASGACLDALKRRARDALAAVTCGRSPA